MSKDTQREELVAKETELWAVVKEIQKYHQYLAQIERIQKANDAWLSAYNEIKAYDLMVRLFGNKTEKGQQ